MNFKLFQKNFIFIKNLISCQINSASFIQIRNYNCEKWNKEQELLKIRNSEFQKMISLNLNQKEIFFYNELNKISEQNNKIFLNLKKQNDEIKLIKKFLIDKNTINYSKSRLK